MKLLLCLGVAIGLIAVASTLTCKSCGFRFSSFCIGPSSTVDCTGNCSLTKAYFGSVSVFTKQACKANCVSSNSTKDGIFDFDYTISCCSTNECNSGNSVKVSFSLGLGLVLLWLLNAV
ncbi:uncharacterized protein PAF06_003302 [Gastrophryne carolinensis]